MRPSAGRGVLCLQAVSGDVEHRPDRTSLKGCVMLVKVILACAEYNSTELTTVRQGDVDCPIAEADLRVLSPGDGSVSCC